MPGQGRVATRAEVAAVGAGFAADQAAQREQPGQWSGQATAIRADGTEVAFSRQAGVSAATGQPGCLTISYDDQLGDQTSHSAVTRCPGRGITGLPLIDGVEIGTLVELAEWTLTADKVLTF